MDCLFCEIIKKKKKAHIIAENEEVVVILDAYPASDGHILLITKKHFMNITEVDEKSWNYLLPLMKNIINKLQTVFQPSGFNIISNMNEIASQSIFHLHVHIIPKYEKNKGFIWTNKPELKYDLEQVAKKLK
jgi:histidine triad (HIT) family protein